ncbi:HxlR family transcriptional regulator [Kitasatospora sp. MMS16-BH015]|uniref:winged helix-turn-helix transcriptional regulator n=1 Tax=Kitasatospora sp. MMS16-BH015 TaxID=2018025 RepID=UPI000CA34656|nr:winged helix-turn-helix transcriptional regulator [Kitasatospora sp. MMS16-BH015]AUG78425.1 HxlR family transcriptional regulator [Kitasatospora sp. MMS16-BH015]
MRYTDLTGQTDCSIAQALGVVGDAWTLLLVRDVAGGVHQFDALQERLGISRKVLTVRLQALVEDGVLAKHLYHQRPPRYEYRLTEAGRGLLPVLAALQDWGSRYVLGDGSLSATSEADSAETRRVHGLVGSRVPEALLPAATAAGPAGALDPVAEGHRWTALYCYPGAFLPTAQAYPPGWGEIPGARGCTLESCTYRDRLAEFAARGVAVRGVSTGRPDQLAEFAAHEGIQFPLLSDAELQLAVGLRLPTFRAAGVDRLKRLTLVVDGERVVRGVLYPLPDPAGSVEDVLALIDSLAGASEAGQAAEPGSAAGPGSAG